MIVYVWTIDEIYITQITMKPKNAINGMSNNIDNDNDVACFIFFC